VKIPERLSTHLTHSSANNCVSFFIQPCIRKKQSFVNERVSIGPKSAVLLVQHSMIEPITTPNRSERATRNFIIVTTQA
jgi:hypothetical protein